MQNLKLIGLIYCELSGSQSGRTHGWSANTRKTRDGIKVNNKQIYITAISYLRKFVQVRQKPPNKLNRVIIYPNRST